jgi:putative iron-regulated protein
MPIRSLVTFFARFLCAWAGFGAAWAQTTPQPSVTTTAAAQAPVAVVVADYAEHCHAAYLDCAAKGRRLGEAVAQLVAAPDADRLEAARTAWCATRLAYARTEVFRFYGGPIDAIEPLVNAWPVDESYIDAVVDRPDAGIVHDAKRFPVLGASVLQFANERGGETNVSVGFHALEFLLWGQDRSATGPGARPCTDFVDGQGRNAARRRQYLSVVTGLLVEQLQQLAAAWAPDAPYRRQFVAAPRAALSKLLAGALVFAAFELAGERLAAAYETQDQEHEHCCFSDLTRDDLVANHEGLAAVLQGKAQGPSVLQLVEQADEAAAKALRAALLAAGDALRSIPHPFDQALLGADDAPGRVTIRAALAALDAEVEALAVAGRVLGFELPLRPGR